VVQAFGRGPRRQSSAALVHWASEGARLGNRTGTDVARAGTRRHGYGRGSRGRRNADA
jgi:hypothetical protein